MEILKLYTYSLDLPVPRLEKHSAPDQMFHCDFNADSLHLKKSLKGINAQLSGQHAGYSNQVAPDLVFSKCETIIFTRFKI